MTRSRTLSGEALASLQRTYRTAPFNQLLGIEFDELHEDGGVTLRMPLAESHLNGDGVAHGGAIFTLADTAISFGIARAAGGRCTTVEAKINYLRPATAGTLTARSHVLRTGRKLVVARGEVHCNGKQIAEMLTTFAVLE